MKATKTGLVALHSLFLAGGLLLAAGPSSGQQTQQLEDITVTSARLVTVGRSQIGGPKQEITISRGVVTDDLDLATPAGMAELEKRVKQVSEELCAELDRLYPLNEPQAADCARNAVKRTMADVKARTGGGS